MRALSNVLYCYDVILNRVMMGVSHLTLAVNSSINFLIYYSLGDNFKFLWFYLLFCHIWIGMGETDSGSGVAKTLMRAELIFSVKSRKKQLNCIFYILKYISNPSFLRRIQVPRNNQKVSGPSSSSPALQSFDVHQHHPSNPVQVERQVEPTTDNVQQGRASRLQQTRNSWLCRGWRGGRVEDWRGGRWRQCGQGWKAQSRKCLVGKI